MSTLGSGSSPPFAGWDWPGAGYAFASQYTVPVDCLVDSVAAYFGCVSGNGGQIGNIVVWDSNTTNVLISSNNFTPANSAKSAGGQQWYSTSMNGVSVANRTLHRNQVIWIGGYCSQGLVFSTYDTSPQSWVVSMPSGLGAFTPGSNSNQGPCGSYLTYSPITYSGAVNIGNRGGGLTGRGTSFKLGSVDSLGGSGALTINNPIVLGNLTDTMGGSGGLQATPAVNVPKIRIWRP